MLAFLMLLAAAKFLYLLACGIVLQTMTIYIATLKHRNPWAWGLLGTQK
jgi:hypothetical protein